MEFEIFDYTLKDVLTIKYGKNQRKVADENGEYPILGTGGVMGYANQFLYNKPSVLIGRKGSIRRVRFIDQPFWTVDTLFYTEINEDIVYPRYIYYYLAQIDFQHYNEGTTIPSLRTETLNRIKVSLPSKAEQLKVLNVINPIEEKIQVNEKMIDNLEQLAQTLFKRWFVDFEFPDENNNPYKSSGGQMVTSQYGLIPKGWMLKTLEEVVDLIIDHRGKTPKKLGGDWSASGYAAISARNIKENRLVNRESIRFLEKELYDKWMRNKLAEGDILLTSEGPLGEMFYLAQAEDYCLSQRLYAIRVNEQYVYPEILFLYMNTPLYKEELFSRATGSTVQGIRQSELRKTIVLVPDIEVQSKLIEYFSSPLLQIYKIAQENIKLAGLRDTLLPKLLSGEIELPDENEVTEDVPIS